LALTECFPNDIEKQTVLEFHLKAERARRNNITSVKGVIYLPSLKREKKHLWKRKLNGNAAQKNSDQPFRVIVQC
jgi:hypothetical protein